MKEKLCFLVAVSGNLAFAAGNIAIALNRHMKCNFALKVYSSDMAETDKKILNSLPNTEVVEFKFESGFVDYMLNALPENCRFKDTNKLMRFCHYEAFKLLEHYENVVWIDCDMSVQADLSGIIQYAPFAMTLDTPWKVGNQFIRPVEGFDMEKDAFCSGIMMLNDSIPYMSIYNWLYEHTKKYAPYMKNGDQAIINLMLQAFDLQPIAMPLEEYQCIAWKKEAIDARVVHFGTDKKVWNDNMLLCCFPEWYRIHTQWLLLGGSDFDRTNMTPQNIYYIQRSTDEKLRTKTLELENISKGQKKLGFLKILRMWITKKKHDIIN